MPNTLNNTLNKNNNVDANTVREAAAVNRANDAHRASLSDNCKYKKHINSLENQILTLAANINAAKYQWLLLLAEFDRLQGWNECGGVASTAHWLSFKCGITPGAARENVRVARALTKLPAISEAFKSGALSYSKVRAMTRAATPENEDYLVMVARHGTGAHMEKLVRLHARTTKLADPDASRRAYAARGLDWRTEEDGTVLLSARLMADQAAAVIGVIHSISQEIQKESKVEDCYEQADDGDDTSSGRYEGGMERRGRQQRADALERLAEWWLAQEQSKAERQERRNPANDLRVNESDDKTPIGNKPNCDETRTKQKIDEAAGNSLNRPEAADNSHTKADRTNLSPPVTTQRHTLMVHVDAAILSQSASEAVDSSGVSAETLSRIGCDAALIASIDDANGKPLNVGRRRRTIPTAIRRALVARDTGCTFPGCAHDRFVDAHHVKHWRHGGETRLDNLILLCRRHHRLLHEGEFTVRFTDGQSLVFYSAKGNIVNETASASFSSISNKRAGDDSDRCADAVDELSALCKEKEINVDSSTVQSEWDGVYPDWSTMVEATLPTAI